MILGSREDRGDGVIVTVPPMRDGLSRKEGTASPGEKHHTSSRFFLLFFTVKSVEVSISMILMNRDNQKH